MHKKVLFCSLFKATKIAIFAIFYSEKQYCCEKVNFCRILDFFCCYFSNFFLGSIPKKKSENPVSPIPKNVRDWDQPNLDFFRDSGLTTLVPTAWPFVVT